MTNACQIEAGRERVDDGKRGNGSHEHGLVVYPRGPSEQKGLKAIRAHGDVVFEVLEGIFECASHAQLQQITTAIKPTWRTCTPRAGHRRCQESDHNQLNDMPAANQRGPRPRRQAGCILAHV